MNIAKCVSVTLAGLIIWLPGYCSDLNKRKADLKWGIELNSLIYSNNEIGASLTCNFDQSNSKSWTVGPLFVTDVKHIRPGAILTYRSHFFISNSKSVSFFTELGGQYYETRKGRSNFTKSILITQGLGSHIRINRKDEIGLFYGMGLDVNNLTDELTLIGFIKLSYFIRNIHG